MYTLLIILFVLVCFAMVVVILLQAGKGQGLAGSIGGGGAGGSVFGGRGAADFLSKATTWIAAIYMVLAIVIGYIYKSEAEATQQSLIEQRMQDVPVAPDANIPMAPIQQEQPEAESDTEQ